MRFVWKTVNLNFQDWWNALLIKLQRRYWERNDDPSHNWLTSRSLFRLLKPPFSCCERCSKYSRHFSSFIHLLQLQSLAKSTDQYWRDRCCLRSFSNWRGLSQCRKWAQTRLNRLIPWWKGYFGYNWFLCEVSGGMTFYSFRIHVVCDCPA